MARLSVQPTNTKNVIRDVNSTAPPIAKYPLVSNPIRVNSKMLPNRDSQSMMQDYLMLSKTPPPNTPKHEDIAREISTTSIHSYSSSTHEINDLEIKPQALQRNSKTASIIIDYGKKNSIIYNDRDDAKTKNSL